MITASAYSANAFAACPPLINPTFKVVSPSSFDWGHFTLISLCSSLINESMADEPKAG
eukprot:CAMPEP_0171458848 /NCGR_PEP_ID=MMETSP0945-20130129/4365_1 /TAXON_ID=109269 /ORGANISM="Vaucheria litorea, Strain CCMP2940" /LENGTH=57 /DNA_ID=CAMNT_0011984743 /DNA_START=268 /DNA_END=441 /DNA_ORIENTATION=-